MSPAPVAMMNLAAFLLVLAQVDEFRIESKKITPDIRKQIAALDSVRLDAYHKACAAVGARLPEKHRIILRLVDGADPEPTTFTRHNGLAAETRSVETAAEIRFYTEYFINGLLQPEETLRHEMVHAVMRIDLGERYQKLPKWLREGIAVHVAEQTARKLTCGFMQKEFAFAPENMIDGLEDETHSLEDYPEDGLAIAFLTSSAPDGLIRLEEALRAGREYREAIASVAGTTFGDFVGAARDHALARIRDEARRIRDDLSLYRDIIEKNEKSKVECERFLKSFPRSPLKSAVLYYRAKAQGNDGIPAYDDFIESARRPGGYPGFIDDAKLRKARLLAKKGETAKSSAVYADLVRWHVGSENAVTALYEWGLQARLIPLLKRALELDPNHRLAERAKKLVGD